MLEPAFLSLQLESLTIRNYLNCYAKFEKQIRTILNNNVQNISNKNLNILHFFEIGTKFHPELMYDQLMLNSNIRFPDKDVFSVLSINSIIRIQRKTKLLDAFVIEVKSINNKKMSYEFTDCCLKIIKMRNRLAHELDNLSFGDSEIIELLSDSYIKEIAPIWFSDLDISHMTDSTKAIFSNFVFLCSINELLGKKEIIS